MDDNLLLRLMSGTDIPMPELGLTLHQPTIAEVAAMGKEDYFIAAQCLMIDKEQVVKDDVDLSSVTNFQIFMEVFTKQGDKRICIENLLSVFFPNHKISYTPRAIVIKRDKDNFIIDEGNFTYFQSIIEALFSFSKSDGEDFNTVSDKAREIAEKLKRARQRVAAQKKDGEGEVISQYLSVLAVGLQMNLQDLLKLTVYQLFDLMERYSLYTNWDLDIRSRLAGADIQSEPED